MASGIRIKHLLEDLESHRAGRESLTTGRQVSKD